MPDARVTARLPLPTDVDECCDAFLGDECRDTGEDLYGRGLVAGTGKPVLPPSLARPDPVLSSPSCRLLDEDAAAAEAMGIAVCLVDGKLWSRNFAALPIVSPSLSGDSLPGEDFPFGTGGDDSFQTMPFRPPLALRPSLLSLGSDSRAERCVPM